MLRTIVLLLCLLTGVVRAEFDLKPYRVGNVASAAIPQELLYPEYFRKTDQINLPNLMNEFRARFEFFSGMGSEPSYRSCFKMQRRIYKGLERMIASAGCLPFNRIDDALIYSDDSPLLEYLRPMPLKTSDFCSFRSFGDPMASGTVYCVFHGADMDGQFYQTHLLEFNAARPAITVFDLVEMLIFLPALFIIPVVWLILKKALENKKPAVGNREG